jgi:hypothetical protein
MIKMALASIGGSAPSFRLAPVEGYAESAFKQGLKEAWRDEHYAEGYFALLIEWILRQWPRSAAVRCTHRELPLA